LPEKDETTRVIQHSLSSSQKSYEVERTGKRRREKSAGRK